MNDASSPLGASAAEAADPIAVSPTAGTDLAVSADGVVADHAGSSPLADNRQGRPLWARLDNPFSVGLLLTLGGLVAILLGLALSNIATILVYIGLAMFAALGLDPVIKWLGKHGVKRGWAIAIIFLTGTIIGVGLMFLVVPTLIDQIQQFFTGLPDMISNFEKTDFYAFLEGIFGTGLTTLLDEVEKFIFDPANIAAISGGLLKVAGGIAAAVSGGLIVVVLTLYFVASLPGIKDSLMQFAPARKRVTVRAMTDQITDSVGGYLMGMVILAFFNSVVATILHAVLQLPYPLLMGVLAFSITIIPLIGPVLYWIVATVIALFTSPLSALIFAICYLIYIQIEAYVLTPKVMNRAIEIPGSLVVIGALIGGTLLGFIGALVAIPVTASILLIIKQVFFKKQDAKI
ncbi:permease [Microbacterium sp. Root166]|jgi:predicted PurR-regulated permease PerM|uniref:AI-2E family transporter n=1 Tax=Microbacterium sp. Root166 TaxID=1736478 RepID=UPI0006F74926|nr:AI-2E family transporter [Microbacterium sp. Root166]KQZ85664.1 permease [Microbacterium sp. Root166]